MTAARARDWLTYAAVVWAVSMGLALLGFATFAEAGFFDFVTALAAIAVAAGIIVFLSWLTSMIAGPAVLIKLRNRPNTLGVWTTIVLPLSVAFACVCAIAVPVVDDRGCKKFYAAVPLIALPLYILGEPEPGFP